MSTPKIWCLTFVGTMVYCTQEVNMPLKEKFFNMRASPEVRAKINLVADLANTDNLSKAIRLALSFAIENAQQFRFWIGIKDD